MAETEKKASTTKQSKVDKAESRGTEGDEHTGLGTSRSLVEAGRSRRR